MDQTLYMYDLRIARISLRHPYRDRIWCTERALAQTIAHSLANFNAFHGTDYRFAEVIVVPERK